MENILQVKISAVKFSLYQTRGLSAPWTTEWVLELVTGSGDQSSHDILPRPPERPLNPSSVPASPPSYCQITRSCGPGMYISQFKTLSVVPYLGLADALCALMNSFTLEIRSFN